MNTNILATSFKLFHGRQLYVTAGTFPGGTHVTIRDSGSPTIQMTRGDAIRLRDTLTEAIDSFLPAEQKWETPHGTAEIVPLDLDAETAEIEAVESDLLNAPLPNKDFSDSLHLGMGATIGVGSDRYAATVVAISNNGRTITIREDRAVRTDTNGMSESQTWVHYPNPAAPQVDYTQRSNGRYVRRGESMKGGQRLSLGHRSTYRDPSF